MGPSPFLVFVFRFLRCQWPSLPVVILGSRSGSGVGRPSACHHPVPAGKTPCATPPRIGIGIGVHSLIGTANRYTN